MKSLLLFPFRAIAFFVRVLLRVLFVPLLIATRIADLIVPSAAATVRSGLNSLINLFRF